MRVWVLQVVVYSMVHRGVTTKLVKPQEKCLFFVLFNFACQFLFNFCHLLTKRSVRFIDYCQLYPVLLIPHKLTGQNKRYDSRFNDL